MIGIVIVNYNGEKFQNECIDSLMKLNHKNFVIIIVDNGSSDNSMKLLDKYEDDRIVKIVNNDNLGVAAGNNIGIKKSLELNCEYTLLLNNDTVCEADFLDKLLELNQDIVCPKIYYYGTKKIWYYGGKILLFKGTVKHSNYQKDKYRPLETARYAPTCCLLIKNTLFSKIGFFDEKYFLYYDDVDFCYRLIKNNIKIYLCDKSVIYHKVSLSSGGEQSPISLFYNNRNRFYFISKISGIRGKISYMYSIITRHLIIMMNKDKRDVIRKALRDFKDGRLGRMSD